MLKQGDKAPDFDLEAEGGKRTKLSDHRGKSAVVYFYPRDNTPGCTVEAIDFSREKAAFDALGVPVFAISRDSLKSHTSFRTKHGLTIDLLSDPDLSVHKAYGAWGEKNMYGKKVEGVLRSTFLVGPDGRVARAWPSVKVNGHVAAVLGALGGGSAAGTPAKKAPAKAAAPAKKAPAKKAEVKKPAPAKKAVSGKAGTTKPASKKKPAR